MRRLAALPLFQLLTLALLVACDRQSPVAAADPELHWLAPAPAWSEPVHLDPPLSSPFRELSARLSRDELSVYITSDRPGGLGGFDIWVARRDCRQCPWNDAKNLGPNINSAAGDGSPVPTPDGYRLFFSSSRPGGHGLSDIWVSFRASPNDDLGWGPAINLGPAVNTDGTEGGPAYAPLLALAGGNLFFNRDNDMYQALVTFFGTVIGTPVAVEELNDPPGTVGEITVRQDGREIFFWSSTRPGGLGQSDIWVATRRSIRDAWSPPQPLGPPVNTVAGELGPGLSWDGETLLFVGTQTRGGSLGFQDVWMSTRELRRR